MVKLVSDAICIQQRLQSNILFIPIRQNPLNETIIPKYLENSIFGIFKNVSVTSTEWALMTAIVFRRCYGNSS
jgi:hypothetical protein